MKKRLRLVVTILGKSNAEIVEKAGFSANSVSDFIKAEGKEPSTKFIKSFCNAFKEANYEFIVNGNGNPTIGVDLSDYGFKQPNEEVTLLKKEMEFMADAIKRLEGQLDFYKQLISQAYKLNPELKGKLLSSLSLHGQNGDLTIPFMTIGDYTRDLAAA